MLIEFLLFFWGQLLPNMMSPRLIQCHLPWLFTLLPLSNLNTIGSNNLPSPWLFFNLTCGLSIIDDYLSSCTRWNLDSLLVVVYMVMKQQWSSELLLFFQLQLVCNLLIFANLYFKFCELLILHLQLFLYSPCYIGVHVQVSDTIASTQPIESLAKRQRLIWVVHGTSVDHLVLGLENILIV